MSETYPRKNLCETLFAGHTPSSARIDCKGTKKNLYVQKKFNFIVIGYLFLTGVRKRVKA